MGENNILIYSLSGAIFGGIVWLCYNAFLKRNNVAVSNKIGNYSIKYHKFLWFILLPAWFFSGIADYALYWEELNFFPFTLFMSLEFVYCVLILISFFGFFKFKKYSLHSILTLLSLAVILQFSLYIYFSILGVSNISQVATIIGEISINVPSFIYYYKRRSIFIGNQKNNANKNSIAFCRNCGISISNDAIYCPNCGKKIK